MKQSTWISASFVVISLVAVGLALAALILALDDDDPTIVGLNTTGLSATELSDLVVQASEAPADPNDLASSIRATAGAAESRLASQLAGRPVLGISLAGDDDLTVRAVLPGSPADAAGVAEGDRIVSINDTPVESRGAIVAILETLERDDDLVISLEVERDGQTETLEIEVSSGGFGRFFFAPGRGDHGPVHPVLGLGVEPTQDGLVVTSVRPDSAAADAGLQEGDILRTLDDDPITDTASARATLAEQEPGDVVTLTVERDGASVDLDVTLGAGLPSRFGFGPFPFDGEHVFPRFGDGDDLPAPFDGLRERFERFFGGEGGPFGFPEDGAFDLQIRRGPVTAIDDDSISIANGDPIALDDATRRPAGDVEAGDNVIVFASGGVATVVAPAPVFPRLPRPGASLSEA